MNSKNLKCSLDNQVIVIWQNNNQSADTNIILHKMKSKWTTISNSDKNTQLHKLNKTTCSPNGRHVMQSSEQFKDIIVRCWLVSRV